VAAVACCAPVCTVTSSGMTVKLNWYRDWRWRYIRDRAGLGLWIGPVGLYLWRR